MPKHPTSLTGLRELLSALLERRHTRLQLHRFVGLCNSIALSLVQSKISAGTIQVKHFGLSPADIAFDAIADLFREDEDGILVQIKVYFESVDWEGMEDEALLIHLRRLVFARTNQGLFRMFQEIDPGLGKILRNTKLAITALNNFVEVDHFGEPCIAPNLCDPLSRLPMIDRDCLERRLLEMTNGSERIPEILARLSCYLREQNEHSRMVPMMWVAYGIRGVYARLEADELEQPEVETSLSKEETRAALHEACLRVKAQGEQKYLGDNSLTGEVYDKYFNVIERILDKRLISNDGHDVSLFKLLQGEMPDVTREEYNARHKSKLEYLARVTEQKAIELLKRNFS